MPALLTAAERDDYVSEHAVSALATLKSAAVFDRVVKNFRNMAAEGGTKMQAIIDVAAYQNAAAADLLVGRLRDLDGKTDDASNELRLHTAEGLVDMFRPAEAAMAPTLGELPDPFADEWEVYWTAARPMLTDTLQPKQTPTTKPSPPVFAPVDFAPTASHVTFSVGVNAPVYRIGDPVRVDLQMNNTGTAPVSTIPPVPYDCWFPQMAYGIKLTRDGKTLFQSEPSDGYIGSYSGPPAFVTLAPGSTFRTAVCLQRWLDAVATPLPAGAYELTVTYDTAKFVGLRLTAIDRTHRWTAAPVRFTISGPARSRPADMMAYVAAITGKPFLEHDLTSQNDARQVAAIDAINAFGDSRFSGPRPYERPATPDAGR